jgi:hypothetical protein
MLELRSLFVAFAMIVSDTTKFIPHRISCHCTLRLAVKALNPIVGFVLVPKESALSKRPVEHTHSMTAGALSLTL